MPAPANNTRPTAEVIPGLPYSTTQDVNDSGTTYTVWYQYVASATGFLKVWGDGNYTAYKPQLFVYENADVAVYMDLGQLWPTNTTPVYIPVTSGNTYFFEFFQTSGLFSNPANLLLTVAFIPNLGVAEGDFLNNLELDGDAEGPMSVLSGTLDKTVKRYAQMATPTATRGSGGLPHGVRGVSFLNGNFGWMDEQFPNFKLYDPDFAEVVAVTLPGAGHGFGVSRVLDRAYIAYDVGATVNIRSYSNVGVLVDTWITTIASLQFIAVNDDNTILYYNRGGNTTILRWDLALNSAMADLVADTAGYRIEDLMVLEDDTILACWHEESGTPGRDVKVLHYSAAGATLHTYEFGDTWRNSFNPPRIGFALDSPTHFWITLKPQGEDAISLFKKVLVSSGAVIDTVTHVNYLAGVQLGLTSVTYPKTTGTTNTFAATYTARHFETPGTVVHDIVGPGGGTPLDIFSIEIDVMETFANNSGTQPVGKVGITSNDDLYWPTTTFVNQLVGASFDIVPPPPVVTTIPVGEFLTATWTDASDLTATGSIQINVAFDGGTAGLLLVRRRVAPPATVVNVLVTTAAFDRTVQVNCTVAATFANNSGQQPTFAIGKTGSASFYLPTSTFTNAAFGATFQATGTLPAGAELLVTEVEASDLTATGSLTVSATLVQPVSQTAIITSAAGQDIKVVVAIRDTFANSTGLQPSFEIGRTGDTDSIAPSSTFTDAAEGEYFEFDATLTAGQDVVVTATRVIGAGTGEIGVGVYQTPSNAGILGAEKSGSLLLANFEDAAPANLIVRKIVVPDTDPQSFDFTTTGGLSPATFSLTHGGSQEYFDIAPDTYGVAETPNPIYNTTVTVSNGDPADAIEIAAGETVTVTFTNTNSTVFSVEVIPRRWLRRSPILWSENRRFNISKFELFMEPGVGLDGDPATGADPQVMMRVSKTNGRVWGNELMRSMGRIGDYLRRAVWWRVSGNNTVGTVIEVSGTDPVKVALVDASIDIEPGTDR